MSEESEHLTQVLRGTLSALEYISNNHDHGIGEFDDVVNNAISCVTDYLNKECWNPTMKLRWKVLKPLRPALPIKHKLQQLWTSNLGKQEWRDIPVEEEG